MATAATTVIRGPNGLVDAYRTIWQNSNIPASVTRVDKALRLQPSISETKLLHPAIKVFIEQLLGKPTKKEAFEVVSGWTLPSFTFGVRGNPDWIIAKPSPTNSDEMAGARKIAVMTIEVKLPNSSPDLTKKAFKNSCAQAVAYVDMVARQGYGRVSPCYGFLTDGLRWFLIRIDRCDQPMTPDCPTYEGELYPHVFCAQVPIADLASTIRQALDHSWEILRTGRPKKCDGEEDATSAEKCTALYSNWSYPRDGDISFTSSAQNSRLNVSQSTTTMDVATGAGAGAGTQ